ncbi:MAG: type II toxin-antitoxin system YafQ family toxin [Denitrovibrio sp.]|nr:MAG: type II toxin-antitoxin system YafQ family toxin [Denitrovibrio sp.]
MKTIVTTSKFKKDFKAYRHTVEIEEALKDIISYLQQSKQLPVKYKDHPLIGEFKGCRDCHVLNDVVLIYEIDENRIILIRIGNHAKLFG